MERVRPENIPKLQEYTPSRFMLPESHYDRAKADRAVKFIESLSHTKGKWARKPFWLFPWQEQVIRDIFGIVDAKGKRQFRTAFVEIGKKRFAVVGSRKVTKQARVEATILNSLTPVSKADILKILPDVSATTVEVQILHLSRQS